MAEQDIVPLELGSVFAHTHLEHGPLQAWRDSFRLAMRTQKYRGDTEVLNPFDMDITARARRRSVVVLDSVGDLVRAYWYFPVYEIYGNFKQQLGVDPHKPQNPYAEEIRVLNKRLEEVNALTSLKIQVNAHYKLNRRDTADHGTREKILWDGPPRIAFDKMHTYGRFPYRDVLQYEDIKHYPILVLQYIDVESTDLLIRYLSEGGIVLLSAVQLDWLDTQLMVRMPGLARRIEIKPDHRLLKEPYTTPGYDLQGIKIKNRLAAILVPRKETLLYSPLLVNVVIHALTQPSSLALHYQEAYASPIHPHNKK